MSDFFVTTEAKRWLMIMSQVGQADIVRSMAEDLRDVMAGGGVPVVPKHPRNGCAEIAAALGMPKRPGAIQWSIDEILAHIARDKEADARLQGKCRDLENDAKQDEISLKFFRDCFEQMKDALYGAPRTASDSALVAEVIEASKQRMADLRDIENAIGAGVPVNHLTADVLVGQINAMRAAHRLALRNIKKELGTPLEDIDDNTSHPAVLISDIAEKNRKEKSRRDEATDRFKALAEIASKDADKLVRIKDVLATKEDAYKKMISIESILHEESKS